MNYLHVLAGCLIIILTVYLQQTSVASSSVNKQPNSNEPTSNYHERAPAQPFGQSRESAMALYRAEHNNSLLQIILSDLFGDINWHTIAEAREQVEKFIRRLEKVWSFFRSSKSPQSSQNPLSSLFGLNSFEKDEPAGAGQSKRDKPRQPFIAKLFGMPATSSTASTALPLNEDPTNLRAMLERVACYVGYMRLLTDSQAALADLDASKVVSNLFMSTRPSTSNNSLLASWFG